MKNFLFFILAFALVWPIGRYLARNEERFGPLKCVAILGACALFAALAAYVIDSSGILANAWDAYRSFEPWSRTFLPLLGWLVLGAFAHAARAQWGRCLAPWPSTLAVVFGGYACCTSSRCCSGPALTASCVGPSLSLRSER